MHQAHAADTKWAIEYWKPAADAFKLNNPDAAVYNGNCNVLLHRAMAKAGTEGQCDASEACVAESAALDADTVGMLPLPGEVDFICGGPPCQARRLVPCSLQWTT
jgi:DNA (cytosine-5)-methyltransferase 1